MNDLKSVVNIGPVLAAELKAVGVDNLEALRHLGAFETCRLLEGAGKRDCTHALLALEGAIRGIRWTSIPAAERAQLSAEWRDR